MIKVNWLKEIIVLGLILAQALFIMYNKDAKPLVFYGVQAIIFTAVILVRLKDLIALVKTLVKAIKSKKTNGQDNVSKQKIELEGNESVDELEGERNQDGRDSR